MTQIEIYFKDKSIDNVAVVSKLDEQPKKLKIEINKVSEGRGAWCELQILLGKSEALVTGRLTGRYDNDGELDAFLGSMIHFLLYIH